MSDAPRPQCVLVVDDSAENVYYLEVLLRGNGFQVRTARNGAEALESARGEPPDLVISDLLMPVMDGYTLCREWRADDVLREVPFVIYTATYTDKQDEALGLGLGADRFVVKPQDPVDLVAIVRDVLERSPGGGTRAAGRPSRQESELLRDYSAALFRKLEQKVAGLDRVNRELSESERRFRQLIMECPVPIFIGSPDGSIETVNERFAGTIGYTQAEIPTIDAWWRLACPDPEVRRDAVRRWSEAEGRAILDGEGPPRADVYRVTCKDGVVRTMEVYGKTIADRLLVVFNDVTAAREAEEKVLRLNRELEYRVEERTAELAEATRELESFSYSVSHDLRAPLRAIDGFSKMLEKRIDGLLDEEGRRLLGVVQRNAQQMASLIDDLLAFSRSGRAEVRKEAIDMGALVREVLDGMLPAADRSRTDVRVGDLPTAFGDRALVRVVLQNVLSNAVKYSSPRDRRLIEIDSRPGPGGTEYFVRDNGVGFDPKYAYRLFGVFQRLHSAAEFEGTGVGLALVKRIVLRHGGKVWAEGEVDRGATFWFTLGGGEAAGRTP